MLSSILWKKINFSFFKNFFTFYLFLFMCYIILLFIVFNKILKFIIYYLNIDNLFRSNHYTITVVFCICIYYYYSPTLLCCFIQLSSNYFIFIKKNLDNVQK